MNRSAYTYKMIFRFVLPIFFLGFYLGCTTPGPRKLNQTEMEKVDIKSMMMKEKNMKTPVAPPLFKEQLSPVIETASKPVRLYTLKFEAAPLGEIIQALRADTNLNLSVESLVDINSPVTVQLNNATLEESLDMVVVKGAGYAWKQEDDSLVIKRFQEKIYQLDYLDMNPSTTIEIGGDMLASSVQDSGVVGKFVIRSERKSEITDVWAGVKAVLDSLKSKESIVQINRTTGIIYMADSPQRIATMVDFLDSLSEVLNRQVFIDAQILEVQLSDTNKYGVDWSKMAIAADRNNLLGFDDFQANFNGGSTFMIAGRSSMGTVINFLETQGDVSVLSNPHLSVMNGQSALMVVGVQFPYGDINGIDRNTETGVTTFGATIKRAVLGLQLGITPQISSNGLITLHIVPTITAIRGQEKVELPTSATTNQSISNPVIDLRELTTRVRVAEGNTIVLAGLISQSKQVDNQSMPILGYLPFLKYLFKHMETTTENRELVIFITPYLRSPT